MSRLCRLVAVAGLLLGVALAGALPASAAIARGQYLLDVTFDSGDGYPAVSGGGWIDARTLGGSTCYSIAIDGLGGVGPVTSVQLVGSTFTADLTLPDGSGVVEGCFDSLTLDQVGAIARHPSTYSVVAATGTTNYLVSGALHHSLPTTAITFVEQTCSTVRTRQGYPGRALGACKWISLFGTWSLTPGNTYPTFGGFHYYDVRIAPYRTPAQTLTRDSSVMGGMVCDGTVCDGRWDRIWIDLGVGVTTVSLTLLPQGYGLAAIRVTAWDSGSASRVAVPARVNLLLRQVVFDTTGREDVEVTADLYRR